MHRLYQSLVFLTMATPMLWSQERGLPILQNYHPALYNGHHQNWAIAQDSSGIMFFGNNDGVLRFDGVQWKKYPNPRGGIVRALAVGRQQKLYLGAFNEFGYLRPDHRGRLGWTILSDSLPDELSVFAEVWRIIVTDDGVFFSSAQRLFLFGHDDRLIRTWTPQGVFRFPYFVNNRFVIQDHGHGLMEYIGDSLRLIDAGEPLRNIRVSAMLPISGDSVWIQTRTDGAWLWSGETIRRMPIPADRYLNENEVYGGLSANDGSFVFWTLRGGLVRVLSDGTIDQIFNRKMGLADNTIYYATMDRSGSLWAAMSRGLTRIDVSTPIHIWREESGLGNPILSIVRHEGKMYIGSSSGLLVMESGDFATPWRLNAVGPQDMQCFAMASHGTDLIVVGNKGIFAVRGKTVTQISDAYAFAISRSVRDSSLLYVGLQNGYALLRKDGPTWTFTYPTDNPPREIRYLAEDEGGDLWMSGTFSGFVRRLPDGSWREYLAQEKHIRSHRIFRTSHGMHFISDLGIHRYDSAQDSLVPDPAMAAILPDRGARVFRMFEDSTRNLWIITTDGTGKVSFSAEKGFRKYTSLERIAMLGDLSAAFTDGRYIWYGGYDGLFRYRSAYLPPTDTSAALPYPLPILSVRVGDSLLYTGQGSFQLDVPLAFTNGEMEFSFADPTLVGRSNARFKYRLEGLESDWQETQNFKKTYSYLPEGSYTFSVRPAELHYDSRSSTFAFTILPPFYRTVWAYGLYVVCAFALIAGVVRFRNLYLERERQRLRMLVEQQTAQLRRQNEELSGLNEKKNEYLGIVAHDLRNPLTSILGFASMLSEDIRTRTLDYASASRDLHHIIKVAEHMNRFVTELLDISSIESGTVRLHREEFDLREAVAECVQLSDRHARQKQIDLTWKMEDGERRVFADRFKVRSVLDNLVSNAIKYTYPGGQVSITMNTSDHHHSVHIRDTGQGLSESDLQKAFKTFGRLSSVPTAGEPSSGLGLAIVKKIVEIHGGRAWVESQLGRGSVFSFSLPIHNGPEDSSS